MKKFDLKKIVFYATVFFGAITIISPDLHAQNLDMVILGNDLSEVAHNIEFTNTSIGIGGLNESYRKTNDTDVENSFISATMKVDPEVQNYLTLKLWGSDTLESRKYYWQSFGGFGRWNRFGSSGSDTPEIINWSSTSIYPDRFVYVTYLLPDDILYGSDTLKFRLAGAELPIYRVYTHTNSFFEPEEDEEQGSAPEFSTPYSSPDGKTQIEHLHTQLDLAVDRFLTWQYYGEEWDTWVANGWAPEIMTGALNTHGAKDSTWTIDEYKATWSARQNGHVRVQMPIETMALAFHKPWSKYYQDSTLIDRVINALDFLRVAQGSDGGYIELENVSGGRWIGAPNRTEGVGSLMGFGMKGAPGAFLAMETEILKDTLMNEIINEGDSLTTRRQAYINLFLGFRSYLTEDGNRGHASNQDIVDLTAAYLADECIRSLAPELAWSEEIKQYYLDVCIGMEDGIYGGPWVSNKGTSMEGNGLARGGYDTGYGEHNTEHYARLAVISGEERISEYLSIHLEALGRIRSLKYDNDLRPVVRRDEWLGWRKNYHPGSEAYGDVPMAAILLDDKLSLRGVQLAAEYGYYYKTDFSYYWVHLMAQSSEMMRKVDYIEQALELPPSDARFPFEEGQPDYAWADEEAALVVIQQDGYKLWATLQWRHPLRDDVRHVDNALTNDIARVHYSTPSYELMGTVDLYNTDGMYSLYIWQYGKYLVLMNASHDTEYEFNLPDGSPSSVMDLISENQISLSVNPVIKPQNTLILEWPEEIVVSVEDNISIIPADYKLEQNYPNPFNPSTTIGYSIAKPGKVKIIIYNTLGQKVKTLLNEHKVMGSYSIKFNAPELTSGVYFYSIQTDGFNQAKKMLLMK